MLPAPRLQHHAHQRLVDDGGGAAALGDEDFSASRDGGGVARGHFGHPPHDAGRLDREALAPGPQAGVGAQRQRVARTGGDGHGALEHRAPAIGLVAQAVAPERAEAVAAGAEHRAVAAQVDGVAGVCAHRHRIARGGHEGVGGAQQAVAVLAAVREPLHEQRAVALHDVVGTVADAGVGDAVGHAHRRRAAAGAPQHAGAVDREPARLARGKSLHAGHQHLRGRGVAVPRDE
jgi:hypothetical protein